MEILLCGSAASNTALEQERWWPQQQQHDEREGGVDEENASCGGTWYWMETAPWGSTTTSVMVTELGSTPARPATASMKASYRSGNRYTRTQDKKNNEWQESMGRV